MSIMYFRDVFRMLLKISPLRFINLAKLYFSFFKSVIIKKPAIWGYPAFITYETGTYCNLSCSECYSGSGNLTRPQGVGTYDSFIKVINKISKRAIYLTLYFQGEPLMNPDFIKMVKYAKSKSLYVSTSTNAHLLNRELAGQLVNSGIDRIIISFDGPDEEVYSSYRNGGSWQKVIDGINCLTSIRKEERKTHPYIILQCLVMRKNEDRLNEVRELAKKSGVDRLEFKTLQLMDISVVSDLLPLNQKYSRYIKNESGEGYILKKRLRNKCWRMWSSLVVTWDGGVLPCCYDKDSEFCMGRLGVNNFSEIWHGEQYSMFREKVFNSVKKISICRNCDG